MKLAHLRLANQEMKTIIVVAIMETIAITIAAGIMGTASVEVLVVGTVSAAHATMTVLCTNPPWSASTTESTLDSISLTSL
jgi:hypothetical protein